MNKILKILSILVIGLVMFSCSTPTNDPTPYVPEPSGPETPVETPTDDPVEETPEVPTYSIIFTTKDTTPEFKSIVAYLDSLPEFKNLEEGTEVILLKHLYINSDVSVITKEKDENSVLNCFFKYINNSEIVEIDSVTIGNEDVYIEVVWNEYTDNLDKEDYSPSSFR